jgi:deoxyribodipyrimidine photolyase
MKIMSLMQQRGISRLNPAEKNGIAFASYKDHVIFSKLEVVKSDQSPYTVFTPTAKNKTLLEENAHLS